VTDSLRRRSTGGHIVRRRLDNGRREELLDGVMDIIVARGFSDVKTAEMARELHCSESSLYKIAPNKDSLMVLAIGRWGEVTLEMLEERARGGKTPSERARQYFLGAAEALRPMSLAFRGDVERFESTRMAYQVIADRFVRRFVELLDDAVAAGEIRPMNTQFLAEILRQIARLIRDEHILRASGLTSEQAALEVDGLIWDGIRDRGAADGSKGTGGARRQRTRRSD
jgi:AcrR family transcriptional regulator